MQPMLFHPQLRSVGQINKDVKLFLSRQWSLPCVDKHAKSFFIPQDLHVNSPFLTGRKKNILPVHFLTYVTKLLLKYIKIALRSWYVVPF